MRPNEVGSAGNESRAGKAKQVFRSYPRRRVRIGVTGAFLDAVRPVRTSNPRFGNCKGQVRVPRWSAGDAERARTLAAELVSAKLDAVMTNGAPATAALHNASSTIPVVFVQIGDPVA